MIWIGPQRFGSKWVEPMNWKWLHGQTKTKEPYPYPCEAATPGRCVTRVTHPRRHDARRSRVLAGATSPPATVVVAKPRRPTTSTPAISAGCRPLPRRRRRVATLGHRTRLHPLDRAPPPPAAGLTPRLSPLGPGELAVERRGCRRPAGGATAGESCSSSSPSPLADPSVLISTAGEKTHKLCYGGWFIR